MRILSRLCWALLLLCLPAAGAERILSYESDIRIAPDASMTVSETIRVVAEGKDIRRGIYRDFPTSYRDRFGNEIKVRFHVLEVSRDELGSAQQKKIEERFEKFFGKPVEADFEVNPSLYGGVRVTAEGTTYDGTLATRLARMKETLVGGA